MKRSSAQIGIVAALLLVTTGAQAKSTQDITYNLDQAFSTAQRFVRVDRGCKITDRDKEVALLVWECKDLRNGKEILLRGTLELFPAKTERGQAVLRLQTSLLDEPKYMEIRFLDLLERKLRDEYGNPPPLPPAPVTKKPDAPPPDMGEPPGSLPTLTP